MRGRKMHKNYMPEGFLTAYRIWQDVRAKRDNKAPWVSLMDGEWRRVGKLIAHLDGNDFFFMASDYGFYIAACKAGETDVVSSRAYNDVALQADTLAKFGPDVDPWGFFRCSRCGEATNDDHVACTPQMRVLRLCRDCLDVVTDEDDKLRKIADLEAALARSMRDIFAMKKRIEELENSPES